MKSVQLTAYGKVADVVKLVDVPDVGTPGPDEIIINVEAGAPFFSQSQVNLVSSNLPMPSLSRTNSAIKPF